MNHDTVHQRIREILVEHQVAAEAKLTGEDTWLQRCIQARVSEIKTFIHHLDESVLINHRHLSLTTSKDEGSSTTVVRAEVARLKQEVRVSERELLVVGHRTHHQEGYLREVAKDLRDRFKQAIFDPPKPEEQTPPVRP